MKIYDYKPRHRTLESFEERRKPEQAPTVLEAWLAGIALVLVLGWFIWGVTA
jgi:hypothetical protein